MLISLSELSNNPCNFEVIPSLDSELDKELLKPPKKLLPLSSPLLPKTPVRLDTSPLSPPEPVRPFKKLLPLSSPVLLKIDITGEDVIELIPYSNPMDVDSPALRPFS